MWKQFHEVFIVFAELRKLEIKASLKCAGRHTREADIWRWGKLFYRPKMLSDDIPHSWSGGG